MSKKGISWSQELVTEIPAADVDYDDFSDDGSFTMDELAANPESSR